MATTNQFEEALAALRAQLGLTDDEVDALRLEARQRAIRVARTAHATLLHQVHTSLVRAFELGQGIEEWRRGLSAQLGNAWGGPSPSRLETIYRNEVQRALNSGRYTQMTRSRVKRLRPYWMFDAVDDQRTTDICDERDGFIAEADDPWWTTNYPILHHRCRSGVRTLTERQAKRKGLGDPSLLSESAQSGFGAVPTFADAVPEPKGLHSKLAERLRDS